MKALITAVVIVALAVGGWAVWRSGNCASGLCRTSVDNYDDKMAAFGKTDPKLLMYREGDKIPTGLKTPRGIALDKAGRIYVVGDYAIRVFLGSGKHILDIRTAAEPHCIAVSDDGTIYAGMRDHVEVFDRTGVRTAVWDSAGKKAYLTSIAVTPSDVWVADASDRIVLRYSRGGQVTATFAAKDQAKNAPGLVVPSPYVDLMPAANGAIWVSDPGRHQLELYASDGRMVRSWGKESFAIDGFSGCCNPTNFAVLADGRFVTSEKGLPRVKVYSPAGKFEGVVAGREAFTPETAGLDIAADANGRILVLDPDARSVRVFLPKGRAQ